jgi:hypothetical protein
MDFTIAIYKQLLLAIKQSGYSFQTFEEFIKAPLPKAVVLRHDVDLLPQNSLRFAQIQNQMGIKGVYYFRAVPESWDEYIITEIFKLGHEVGYHYECLTTCKGNMQNAIKDFETNLTKLRSIVPVSTICMHGSPMSKYDSKDLWKLHNYTNYDIIGEPYFDVNFNKVYYLTDTGRKWDGERHSVRDKVNSSFNLHFHTTNQLIKAFSLNELPNQIMFTFHPQRWNDNLYLWTKELFLQNIKNFVKQFFFVR